MNLDPRTLPTWAAFAGATAALFVAGARLRRRAPVGAFLARRAALLLIAALAVDTATFLLMRAAPGGPFDAEAPLDPAVKERLAQAHGFHRPAFEQWLDGFAGALRFDFGPSLRMRDFDVSEIVSAGLPRSAALGAVALALALLIGVPAGVASAAAARRPLDRILTGAASIGLALPTFVVASLLLVVFGFRARLLPVGGSGSWRHLVMPAFALALPVAAAVARLVRSGTLDNLGSDFVRAARARGLGPARVLLFYALPPALPSVAAYLGPASAAVLTGSLVVESIFGIPGMGTHFIQSALNRDYPVASAAALVYVVFLSALTAAADALHAALDPRVKLR